MKKILRLSLSFLLGLTFIGISFNANAQGVTTASIRGVISGDDGSGLPGATVMATHLPSGTVYGASTRADGKYNLPNLRVGGPYEVKVSFVGYSDQTHDGIQLSLGQSLTMNFEMKEDVSALEEVVVTAESGLIDADRTGPETRIDNEQLMVMPTITRSAGDIYRLSPQASGNSFGGRNDQYNNFSLDGSIFNNPFGLDAATPGGQTNAQPVSLDAIDQIQVSIAPFDVTQSGFTGASVNAVTKSGTNKFSGTVFGFYRNDAMTGSKVSGEEIFVPDLAQLQTGFSIGGPIIKDKLFFFANFELERREDLGSSYLADRGTAGSQISRVTAADLDLVSSTLAGLGYETGAYEGYTHRTDNQKGIIKLDWNINQNHTLTATYNFLDASRDLNAHPSAIGRRGPDLITLQFENSGYQINNKINSGIVELRSLFGNQYSNKLQVGYTFFNDFRNPFSDPFPVLNINKDGNRYIVAGHEPFSVHNRLKQTVLQISDNFNIYMGDHTITVGGSFEKFMFDNSFNLGVYEPFPDIDPLNPYLGGTFGPGFASVQDFVDYVNAGHMQPVADFAQGVYDNNEANDTWALAETNVGQLAAYAQDQWQVSDDLTLTLGLRIDLPMYFDTQTKIEENIARKGGYWDPDFGNYNPDIEYYDTEGNPVYFNSTDLPEKGLLISPRFGFNWDASGNKTLQVRGGSGLFSGRFPFVWIGNQVANPDFFYYTMTDKGFKYPQVWRNNIGVDKVLDNGLSLSADIMYTKDLQSMMVRNFGFKPPSATLNDVDDRPIYDSSTDRAVNQFGGPTNAYVFTNEAQGNSFNFTLEAKKSWENNMFASLAYNYMKSQDVSSIEAEISGDAFDRNPTSVHVNTAVLANSVYGNRHRIVGMFNKKFEYSEKMATTVSLFFEYVEGGRFSYVYAGDINNDGVSFNDLLYVPTDAEIDQMVFETGTGLGSQAVQRDAYKAYVAQDKYLSGIRGEYAERNGALSPWYSNWDLRVLQDLNLNSHKFQVSLDILNVGNLISSNWGVRQFPHNNQPISVSVDPVTNIPTYGFDGSLEESFSDSFDLLSRWRMQLGLRYSF
ncbi:MAG: carboxypeptidase regulatory-like domain-containing protein [Bacteroidota bacterium]